MENATMNYGFEIENEYLNNDTYNDDRLHLEMRIDRDGFIGCVKL